MRTALICLLVAVAGCAGPNRLTRGLDLRVNQLYVDSPTLAEVLLPVTFVGANLAMVTDACFVNPWYFWSDVRVGRGTAYFYEDPVTPENLDPAKPAEGAPDSPDFPEPEATVPLPPPEPPPPADLTSTLREPRPYTVQVGDTLASISRKQYGKPQHWKRIYMANQSVLSSPDAIKPGQTLALPPLK